MLTRYDVALYPLNFCGTESGTFLCESSTPSQAADALAPPEVRVSFRGSQCMEFSQMSS